MEIEVLHHAMMKWHLGFEYATLYQCGIDIHINQLMISTKQTYVKFLRAIYDI